LDADTRQAIATLADELDVEAAMTVWKAALATVWQRPSVWVHGDVTNSNLLVQGGLLCAVLDFGCSAVGALPATVGSRGRTSFHARAARRSAPDSRSMRAPGRAAVGGRCGRR
jgi:aminoglycoside phosphotransferase (APT) family kinase protein